MSRRQGYQGPAQHPHRTLFQRIRDWWQLRKANRR